MRGWSWTDRKERDRAGLFLCLLPLSDLGEERPILGRTGSPQAAQRLPQLLLVSLCQAGSPPGIILRDSTPSGLPFTEYTGGTEPGFTCILPLNAQTMLQEVLIILMLQVGQPRLRQVKLLTHSPGCGASRGTDSDHLA